MKSKILSLTMCAVAVLGIAGTAGTENVNAVNSFEPVTFSPGPGVVIKSYPAEKTVKVYLDYDAAVNMIKTEEGGSKIFGRASIVGAVLNSFLPLKGVLQGIFKFAAAEHESYAKELRSKLTPRGLIIVRDQTGQRVLSR